MEDRPPDGGRLAGPKAFDCRPGGVEQLYVADAVEQPQAFHFAGIPQREGEFVGGFDPRGPAAEGGGKGGEIRIGEVGRHHSARELALLVHADGAVSAVVDDDDEQIEAVLGDGDFLMNGQELATATTQRSGNRNFAAIAAGTP